MTYRVLACLLGAGLAVQAQVISWNLDDHGTLNGPSVSYNGSAGVILVSNWNDSYPDNPTARLKDDSGTATTLNLAYGSHNTFHIQDRHPGPDADGSYNKELLNGYLNAGTASWDPPLTNSFVTLTNIPYSRYDVYVYFSSDAAGRIGNVTDGATTYYFSTLGSAAIAGSNALFQRTIDRTGHYPGANYAIFLNETTNFLTVTANALGGDDQWLGIAGFQVVAMPEPHGAE